MNRTKQQLTFIVNPKMKNFTTHTKVGKMNTAKLAPQIPFIQANFVVPPSVVDTHNRRTTPKNQIRCFLVHLVNVRTLWVF